LRRETSGGLPALRRVEVLPGALVALESRQLPQFARLAVHEVLRDELDLAGPVAGAALAGADDREVAPVRLADRRLELAAQAGRARVRVGRLDEVVDEPEEVRAVARAHELLGGLRL